MNEGEEDIESVDVKEEDGEDQRIVIHCGHPRRKERNSTRP